MYINGKKKFLSLFPFKELFYLFYIMNITSHYDKYILNFGYERIDYFTFEDMINIIINDDTVLKYIEMKHFNNDFKENNNIRYHKYNICSIKENNKWTSITIDSLTDRLFEQSLKDLDKFCNINFNLNITDFIHTKQYKSIKKIIKNFIKIF
jgi:hypothetical protein